MMLLATAVLHITIIMSLLILLSAFYPNLSSFGGVGGGVTGDCEVSAYGDEKVVTYVCYGKLCC